MYELRDPQINVYSKIRQHAFANGVYKERDKTTIFNIKKMRRNV